MKKQMYVVSIERKDGTMNFLRPSASSGLANDAASAHQFDVETPKTEILAFIDKAKVSLGGLGYMAFGTIRIMLYETDLGYIDADDPEWKTAIQRHAVGKLIHMEIEALGLEKFEIERRMGED